MNAERAQPVSHEDIIQAFSQARNSLQKGGHSFPQEAQNLYKILTGALSSDVTAKPEVAAKVVSTLNEFKVTLQNSRKVNSELHVPPGLTESIDRYVDKVTKASRTVRPSSGASTTHSGG